MNISSCFVCVHCSDSVCTSSKVFPFPNSFASIKRGLRGFGWLVARDKSFPDVFYMYCPRCRKKYDKRGRPSNS